MACVATDPTQSRGHTSCHAMTVSDNRGPEAFVVLLRMSTPFQLKYLGNDTSPSNTVRNIGVVFYSNFSFHQYFSQVCRSRFYHICDFRRIRCHLSLLFPKQYQLL